MGESTEEGCDTARDENGACKNAGVCACSAIRKQAPGEWRLLVLASPDK